MSCRCLGIYKRSLDPIRLKSKLIRLVCKNLFINRFPLNHESLSFMFLNLTLPIKPGSFQFFPSPDLDTHTYNLRYYYHPSVFLLASLYFSTLRLLTEQILRIFRKTEDIYLSLVYPILPSCTSQDFFFSFFN